MNRKANRSEPNPTQHVSPMLEAQLETRTCRILGPLCLALPVEEIPQLREQVHQHVEAVRQALAYNEFLDMATVERIAKVLGGLLDAYGTYPKSHRALIIGAVRYFTKADDAEPDTMSLLGFDDDVAVTNCVLDVIGARELKIEL